MHENMNAIEEEVENFTKFNPVVQEALATSFMRGYSMNTF
jgi:hypothetical protein